MTRMTDTPGVSSRAETEGLRTLADLTAFAAARYSGTALRYRTDAGWQEMSYPQLGQQVPEIAKGLIALGVEPGDRVGILANTRPEWTLSDLGALTAGATVAPVYHTNSPDECVYVLTHSDTRVLFCEEEQLEKVAGIRDRCPALEQVIAFSGSINGSISLDELRERGAGVSDAELAARSGAVSPGDLATIVYTSGTTGPPKGCMLTHDNLRATMDMYRQEIDFHETHTVFMFLPLAHSLARVAQMVSIEVGATIAYWGRDPGRLLEDIAEVQPSHLPSVPRVFEKIHTAAVAGIDEQSFAKRMAARWALETARRARTVERGGKELGRAGRRRRELADRLVLGKVRALFGGRLELALSGAAPIAKDVLEFFDSCGIPILEGYGLSESCAAGTLNTKAEQRYGTVGKPLPDTQVKTSEDGELLLYGPHVFAGYYKDPEATSETLEDGWLRTGDLGRVDADGFVSITGRKKDLIITSSGKNISPTNIENQLKESRWISEAVVYGDRRPYLVALINLDPDEVPALAERLGLEPSLERMAADPRVYEEIQREVDAANSHFARIEQIKRFKILDHSLSQATGDLTPTLKVKRNVVYEKYADDLTNLYEATND